MTADQGGPLVRCAEHLVIVGTAPGAALGNGAMKALADGLGVVVDIFWAVCTVIYVKRKFLGDISSYHSSVFENFIYANPMQSIDKINV